MLRYAITHTTTYSYAEPASLSHNLLRLTPRATPRQRVDLHRIRVGPAPAEERSRSDAFGNQVRTVLVPERHTILEITAESTLAVAEDPVLDPAASPAWESCRPRVSGDAAAAEFAYPSPLVPMEADAGALAARAFTPGRPVVAALSELCRLIQQEFIYDPRATTVATPVSEVLRLRRGVCQDFAQLALSGLRTLGLAGRYVSGYLETDPPPGTVKLRGADASHAWISLPVPGLGWIDADPTNGGLVGHRHLTLAWGRDFADVSPVRGVVLGGGTHQVNVAVDVERLSDAADQGDDQPRYDRDG